MTDSHKVNDDRKRERGRKGKDRVNWSMEWKGDETGQNEWPLKTRNTTFPGEIKGRRQTKRENEPHITFAERRWPFHSSEYMDRAGGDENIDKVSESRKWEIHSSFCVNLNGLCFV